MTATFCGNCGASLGASASFCASCGKPVGAAAPMQATPPPAQPPYLPPAVTQAASAPASPPPTAETTSDAPRARVWQVLIDSGTWKRWSGDECKGDLTRVGGKVKRKEAASTAGFSFSGGGSDDNVRLPKERTYEVMEVVPGSRLVLRAKTWVSETVERWELADAGAGTAIAVWVSVSGPLGGVAGALNKLGYGTKVKALAAEAEGRTDHGFLKFG